MIEYEFLKKHSLFGGVTEAECRFILPLLKEASYSRGQPIVEEGRVNDRIYFIWQGSVEVLKAFDTPAGSRKHRIAELHEGDTFGEMELIDVQPCAATVQALEDTVLLTLSHRDLYRVSKQNLKTYTLIIMNLAREISRRLRRMDDLLAKGLTEQARAEAAP
jgi:CRP-like cAMP-binding protein